MIFCKCQNYKIDYVVKIQSLVLKKLFDVALNYFISDVKKSSIRNSHKSKFEIFQNATFQFPSSSIFGRQYNNKALEPITEALHLYFKTVNLFTRHKV